MGAAPSSQAPELSLKALCENKYSSVTVFPIITTFNQDGALEALVLKSKGDKIKYSRVPYVVRVAATGENTRSACRLVSQKIAKAISDKAHYKAVADSLNAQFKSVVDGGKFYSSAVDYILQKPTGKQLQTSGLDDRLLRSVIPIGEEGKHLYLTAVLTLPREKVTQVKFEEYEKIDTKGYSVAYTSVAKMTAGNTVQLPYEALGAIFRKNFRDLVGEEMGEAEDKSASTEGDLALEVVKGFRSKTRKFNGVRNVLEKIHKFQQTGIVDGKFRSRAAALAFTAALASLPVMTIVKILQSDRFKSYIPVIKGFFSGAKGEVKMMDEDTEAQLKQTGLYAALISQTLRDISKTSQEKTDQLEDLVAKQASNEEADYLGFLEELKVFLSDMKPPIDTAVDFSTQITQSHADLVEKAAAAAAALEAPLAEEEEEKQEEPPTMALMTQLPPLGDDDDDDEDKEAETGVFQTLPSPLPESDVESEDDEEEAVDPAAGVLATDPEA